MQDKFTVVGDQLSGRGLTFDVSALVAIKVTDDPESRASHLAEICEAIYLQGRASLLPSRDDRFELSLAVEALRALAVVVGNIAGDRHRRAADSLGRLLQEQERGM